MGNKFSFEEIPGTKYNLLHRPISSQRVRESFSWIKYYSAQLIAGAIPRDSADEVGSLTG